MKLHRPLATILLTLLTTLLTTAAFAAGEWPYRLGPASAALGGAGRAAKDPTEAGWLNPASLVHAQSMNVAISTQQASRNVGGSYRDYGIMLADGGEDKIAAGSFGFVQRTTLTGGATAVEAKQKDMQASLAAFIPDTPFSLGLTYHRLVHEQANNDITQDNYSIGALVPVTNSIGVGVVGTDLAGASDAVPVEARMIPTIGIGVHAVPHTILHVRADLVRPLELNDGYRNNAHLGLESWFDPNFAFRLGGAWIETRDEMWVTAGLGFKGPRLSFGYSYEKDVRTTDSSRHTFDLWIPL